jgi:hypothetical protein
MRRYAYNSNLTKQYSPDDVLAVITAANNLMATRAPLSDMTAGAGTQLRDGFVGGFIEGMSYSPGGGEFRRSYSNQLNKLMTEEDQVYYLGRGMSPLYSKNSPFSSAKKPMMPTSITSLRSMHTTENTTPI